jgi:hypothetical protein
MADHFRERGAMTRRWGMAHPEVLKIQVHDHDFSGNQNEVQV